MKQTAVVFEARIQSAGSAIDLNNTGCADSMQGEKTREMKRGRKDNKLRKREKVGKNKGARDEGSV